MRIDSLGAKRQIAWYQAEDRLLRRHRQELTGKGWIQDPSVGLRKRPDVDQKMMLDPVIRKAFEVRMHMVAGTDIYFSTRDKRAKILVEYFEELFDKIPDFDESRLNLTRAVLEGSSWLRMMSPSVDSRFRIASDPTPRCWWYPGKLKHYNAKRVREEYEQLDQQTDEDGDTWRPVRAYWTYYDAQRWTWYRMNVDPDNPEWVRCVYHDSDYHMGYGEGLRDSLYFWWEAKSQILRSLLEGLDRFGWPFLIGKMRADAGRTASSGAPNEAGDDRASRLLAAINKSRGNQKALVVDVEDSIEAISVDGAAVQHMLSVLEYLDKAMVELILASSMPTGGGQQGSFARAAVEAGSTSTLIKYDRKIHEKSLQQIVNAVWIYNQRGNCQNFNQIDDPRHEFAGNKLSVYKPPTIHIGKEETDDPNKQLDIIRGMHELGLPILKAEGYERLGFTQPDGDDDVIQPLPMSGGGMPGDAMPGPEDAGNDPGYSDGVVMSEQPRTVASVLEKMMAGSEQISRGYPAATDAVMHYLNDHRQALREGA